MAKLNDQAKEHYHLVVTLMLGVIIWLFTEQISISRENSLARVVAAEKQANTDKEVARNAASIQRFHPFPGPEDSISRPTHMMPNKQNRLRDKR